ncbi:hypothetical protein DdX_16445 [Ditylenchus destructor]|uniref:Uncharacterized protein n=1 Tax=Ditylenchus destructor TaxID=166010 RepID=A0AAD4MQX0_9BILA|nr:hypothetical protein DdX_16445 [Ditylenchus destructor]
MPTITELPAESETPGRNSTRPANHIRNSDDRIFQDFQEDVIDSGRPQHQAQSQPQTSQSRPRNPEPAPGSTPGQGHSPRQSSPNSNEPTTSGHSNQLAASVNREGQLACKLLLKLTISEHNCTGIQVPFWDSRNVIASEAFSFDVYYNRNGQVPNLMYYFEKALEELDNDAIQRDQLEVVKVRFICPFFRTQVHASMDRPVSVPVSQPEELPFTDQSDQYQNPQYSGYRSGERFADNRSQQSRAYCERPKIIQGVQYEIEAELKCQVTKREKPFILKKFWHEKSSTILGEAFILLTLDFRRDLFRDRSEQEKNRFDRTGIFRWSKYKLLTTNRKGEVTSTVTREQGTHHNFRTHPPQLKLLLEQLVHTLPEAIQTQVDQLEIERVSKWYPSKKIFIQSPMIVNPENWKETIMYRKIIDAEKYAILFVRKRDS